jgi:hypothetical protein
MVAADWINVVLAVVTTLMAGGTVYLAWYTRNLAKETAEGIEQAERHHQEDLRPFCMIDFNYPTDQDPFGIDWNSNSRLAEAKRRGEECPPPMDTIAIRGELRNKGKGLAKDVVAYLNKRLGQGEEHAYRLTRPVVVSGRIGAEEVIKIDVPITERDVMQVRDARLGWRPFETTPFVINDTYEVVLEYKDVFGNVFRTIHPRGLWLDQADVAVIGDDKAKQREMMARHNKPTPVFLTGRQAAQTATDINIPFPHQTLGLKTDID